jgi:hypothetical protein
MIKTFLSFAVTRVVIAGLMLVGTAGCRTEDASVQSELTTEQLAARFPYDLGPDRLNVFGYPEQQRQNYAVFRRTCAQCHTLARSINAPYVTREDWTRFIQRMHLRAEARHVELTKEEADRVIEFLTYDATLRKIEKEDEFTRQQDELEALFVEIKKKKQEMQIKEGAGKARPAAPYVGDKP